MQYRQRLSADPSVRAGCYRERHHRLVPQTIGIDSRARGKMQHAVILREQMDPSTRMQHPPELGQQLLGIWHQLRHVTAHEQINTRLVERQVKSIPLFKPNFRTRRGRTFS